MASFGGGNIMTVYGNHLQSQLNSLQGVGMQSQGIQMSPAHTYQIGQAAGWTGASTTIDTIIEQAYADIFNRTPNPSLPPAREVATTMTDVALLEKPISKPIQAEDDEALLEYGTICDEIGLSSPHIEVERFKQFLAKENITVFDLKAVVAYMDVKAKKEGTNSGWHWKPLREKDKLSNDFSFGKYGENVYNNQTGTYTLVGQSDWYWAPTTNGLGQRNECAVVYPHAVPLHALKKAAKINKQFGDKVKLMVCDYTPKLEFRPDPFLMAVIPNPSLNLGEGRFVIDFWDEPGFGLKQQLGV